MGGHWVPSRKLRTFYEIAIDEFAADGVAGNQQCCIKHSSNVRDIRLCQYLIAPTAGNNTYIAWHLYNWR